MKTILSLSLLEKRNPKFSCSLNGHIQFTHCLLPPPKFTLLFESISFLVLQPTKSVPRSHIHSSSFCFSFFTSITLSSNTTVSLLIGPSRSPMWYCSKCAVIPQAVQFPSLISLLCLDHRLFISFVDPT